jgi:predicted glycosyltransferase
MHRDPLGPRLLIYSQDGLGLGHLRRTTLLAAEFLTSRPDGSVLTISDSPLGQFFSAASGHDYLKLPSIRKVGPGHWSPVSLSAPFQDVLALRKATIHSVATSFEPDVVLVDHMPHGAMGELVPTLEALAGTPARMVLGIRDIIDAPATVRRRWRLEGAFEAVESYFEDVLVYGAKDVFDVGAQYAWPAGIRDRLRYCGYVCAPTRAPAADAVRQRHLAEHPDSQLLVAMAGGGADGFELFETLVRALPAMTAERPCVLVVVTGPFLPEAERTRLHQLSAGLPVHLVPQVDDSLSYLSAADLVIAMAGYNTTSEILSLGARALLVPRKGPSAEQQMRASRFAQRGWVDWLPPASLCPETLSAAVLEALDKPAEAAVLPPDLFGRQRAARHLLYGGAREDADGEVFSPTGSDDLFGGAPQLLGKV